MSAVELNDMPFKLGICGHNRGPRDLWQLFHQSIIYCCANHRPGGWKGPLEAFKFVLQTDTGSNTLVPFLTEDCLVLHELSPNQLKYTATQTVQNTAALCLL